jgi:integrase
VRDVELLHVVEILEPIWTTKTETAIRVRGRIEAVLDWARVRGYRQGDNPARWRGHLDKILPSPGKVSRGGNHPALDWRHVGAFWEALGKVEGVGAAALRFAILTASRSGEVRRMTWAEIDAEDEVWTVPAERMKAGREHRVPLSDEVRELLVALPRVDGCALVFPGVRGGEMSDATIAAVIRRMHEVALASGGEGWIDRKQGGRVATPHGVARSTFRDWAAEATAYPREVAEAALAHTVEDKTEAAYRRGDLFDKRRRMMEDWAAFLAAPSARAGTVTPIRGAA